MAGILRVVIFVEEETLRHHCAKLFGSPDLCARQSKEIVNFTTSFHFCQSLEEAATDLRRHFGGSGSRAAVLISDRLVQPALGVAHKDWELACAAEEMRAEFAECGYVSVALMEKPTRINNIDLALGHDLSPDEWLAALKLLTDRLSYFARPGRRDPQPGVKLEVRPIETAAEMFDAFRLRYQVYRIMGYLEPEAEHAQSRLEIHWCDTISLHFGAFARTAHKTELVGTARVVMTCCAEGRYGWWMERILEPYPQLVERLKRQRWEYAQWLLPVFHTMSQLNTYIRDVYQRGEQCGELSRVIVREDYRGMGLSCQLVEKAIEGANEAGVSRLLLECLALHQPLYEKFDFSVMPDLHGEVMGIGKTMIAMERGPRSSVARRAARSVSANTGR